MSDIRSFKAESINNIEEYAGALLIATAALGTVINIEARVRTLGILETDEEDMSKSIDWQVRRLFNLLRKQMENVLERSPLSEVELIEAIKKLHPEFFK